MPLYDFRCTACDKIFERLVRGSTLPTCPHCGGTALEKQVSLPAPQGQIAGIFSAARAQAAREGHFSNYAPSERPKV